MLLYLKENLWGFLLAGNYLCAFVFAVILILKNRNPSRTIAYIFVLSAVPFLGFLVYYLFGQDYRKAKIFDNKKAQENNKLKSFKERVSLAKDEQTAFKQKYGSSNSKIRKLLKRNQEAVLTYDNHVVILRNGEEKFAKLEEDLNAAKFQIHIEYFAVNDDPLGLKIIKILCDCAQRGVTVRFIYDDVGSNISAKTKEQMTKSGIQHFAFMPVLFSNSTSKLNYRNHKKIIVIDGLIGYIGGINVQQKIIPIQMNFIGGTLTCVSKAAAWVPYNHHFC